MNNIKYIISKFGNVRFFKGFFFRASTIGFIKTIKEWCRYVNRYSGLIEAYGYKPSLKTRIKWALYVFYNYTRHAFLSYDSPEGFIDGCVPMGISYKYMARKIGHYEYLYQQNDKLEFYRICEYLGIGYPKVYFLSKYGRAFDMYGLPIEDLSLFNSKKMFVKPFDGASGLGAYVTTFNASKINLHNDLLYCAIEENHKKIKVLSNVTTYNTVRIQSYLTKENKLEINCAFIKLSFDNSVADNIAQGGMGVAINPERGCLLKYGYDEETKHRYEKHPNSDVVFEGYQIPFWNQILGEVEMLHRHLGGRWIGWDIGISERGPVYIEANSGGGMLFQQSACHVNFIDQQLIKENLNYDI